MVNGNTLNIFQLNKLGQSDIILLHNCPYFLSFQSVDTYAVCSNCSSLSYNINNCDKCGSALSADNAAECYTADPKRARTDSSIATRNSNSITNGTSSSRTFQVTSSATTNRTNTIMSNAQPVPQALYMNTSNIAGGGSRPSSGVSQSAAPAAPSVRPQALYVNVNNQMLPAMMSAAGTTQSVSSASLQASSGAPVLRSATTQLTTQSRPQPMINNNMGVTSGVPPLYSSALPPGVMPGMGMHGSIMSGQAMNHAAMPRAGMGMGMAINRPPPSYPNLPTPPSSASPQVATPAPNVKVQLPVNQIRIGLKRFSPAASVQFKDDGVMFTLKGKVLVNCSCSISCTVCTFSH